MKNILEKINGTCVLQFGSWTLKNASGRMFIVISKIQIKVDIFLSHVDWCWFYYINRMIIEKYFMAINMSEFTCFKSAEQHNRSV